MRQIPAAVAVLGLSALALVGCAATGPADAGCERVSSDSSALDLITASGEPGQPAASTDAPVYVDETVYSDVRAGEGTPISSRAQDVQLNVAILNGKTGQSVLSAPTQVTSVESLAGSFEGLAKMLDCAAEGSRVIGAVPSEDIAPEALPQLGLEDGDSAVFVVDVNKVFLGAANGVPQYVEGSRVPTVVLAPDGTPGVVVPDAAPPSELVVKVLKKGDGEVVDASNRPRVHYTGVDWETGEVFDSSWTAGTPQTFSLDQVVEGFGDALEGQTVGSQILAVIPPELGYGEEGSGAIAGGATLVFVIDILGIDDVSPEQGAPTQ